MKWTPPLSAPSAVALLATLFVLGCGGESPFEVVEEVTFDPSLNVDLSQMTKTASGLYYQDIVVGTGDPAATGDQVTVEYAVYHRSGEQIDSSDEAHGPIVYTIGDAGYIAGFIEGVTGMRLGGQRKLVVPPDLGFNTQGPDGILIFDLELTDLTSP